MVIAKNKKNKELRLGLRGKLVVGIILPAIVILCFLAVLLTTETGTVVSQMKSKNITSQINAASVQIQEYFEKFFVSQEFIKRKRPAQQLLAQVQTASSDFRFETSPYFDEVMFDLKQAQEIAGSSVQAVWFATVKNSQVMQSDGFLSDSSYQVTQRPWYQLLTTSGGESVLTEAYQDSSTGKMIVTVATPILDGANNIVGAFGTDILLDELVTYFDTIHIGESGYVTVYDSKKNIIYHPNQELIMTNLNQIDYSQNMTTALTSNQTSELFQYTRQREKFYGSTMYIEKTGWTILGCMPKREYIGETMLVAITTILGFAVCILILVFICLYRAKKIINPVHLLSDAAQNFSKGNLDVQIQVNSNDEISDLADVFTKTGKDLKHIISDIDFVLEGISSKDLTVDTTAYYEGDFAQIQISLRGIIERMNMVMSIINQTSDQVAAGAEQVSFGAQSLAQGAAEQASSVQELASTIEQISDEMNRMSREAQVASSKANEVGLEMRESNEKMQAMMRAMTRINQSSNEIEKIIKTIEDIAFQTNILALNAAVEAARAGSAGKGFAVVADEVRNLASKSAEASKNTATLIENSLSAVRDGMVLADETSSVLLTAVAGVGEVSSEVGTMSQGLLHQVEAMQQITQGVDEISAVVQTTSATAEQSAAASEQLSAQAQNLKNMMMEFRLQPDQNNFV